MSALWTLNRGTDRLCGVVVAGPGAPGPAAAAPSPAGPPFRFLRRGPVVTDQHRLQVSARSRPGPACTARGWGGTGQGLSVLHEPRPFVEYTRPSFRSTPPSCSTRRAPPGWPSVPLRRRDQASPFSGKTTSDSHARATHPAGVSDTLTPEPLRSHETTPHRRCAVSSRSVVKHGRRPQSVTTGCHSRLRGQTCLEPIHESLKEGTVVEVSRSLRLIRRSREP